MLAEVLNFTIICRAGLPGILHCFAPLSFIMAIYVGCTGCWQSAFNVCDCTPVMPRKTLKSVFQSTRFQNFTCFMIQAFCNKYLHDVHYTWSTKGMELHLIINTLIRSQRNGKFVRLVDIIFIGSFSTIFDKPK